jgi:hypothetical protein
MRSDVEWEDRVESFIVLSHLATHVFGCVLGYLLGNRLFRKELIGPLPLTLLYVVHFFANAIVGGVLEYVLNLFRPGLSNWTFWLGSGETV